MRLSDEELIDIAWEAVGEIFPSHVLAESFIEIRHSIRAPADIDAFDDDKIKASVWFVHQTDENNFDPYDIANANKRIWVLLRERGDPRYITLTHGYRSDPDATRKAA